MGDGDIQIEFFIHCDRCNKHESRRDNLAAELRKQGWIINAETILCPNCKEADHGG